MANYQQGRDKYFQGWMFTVSDRFAQCVYHFGSLSVAAQKVFVFQKINFTGETMNVIHAAEQIRAG